MCVHWQTATLLGYLYATHKVVGPHLIVAPGSTLDNWVRELQRWCPALNVVCFGGSADERDEHLARGRFPSDVNVVVSSYTYFSRDDCARHRKFLTKQPWEYMVRVVLMCLFAAVEVVRVAVVVATAAVVMAGVVVEHDCCVTQVLDEAHGIKNSATSKFQRLMKVQAKRKLLLTGTPVQNNLVELFTVLRFTMPDVFQSGDVA